MYAMAEERISAPFEELFYTRLVMNDVVRFLLNHPPEKNYFLVLLNDPCFQSLVEINENARKIAEEIKRFRSSETLLKEAVSEYNDLFVGPNPLPAPLWESVYLGREHILFDEQTLKARTFYRKYGLNFIFENNQPDDHIAVELEFLAYLIRASLESESVSALNELMKDQLSFMNSHLGNWVPSFCGRLLKGTEHPLYQGLASLLKDFIGLELETAEFLEEWLR
jgi:putative dimethyl sulfoxide reductase chaperone